MTGMFLVVISVATAGRQMVMQWDWLITKVLFVSTMSQQP